MMGTIQGSLYLLGIQDDLFTFIKRTKDTLRLFELMKINRCLQILRFCLVSLEIDQGYKDKKKIEFLDIQHIKPL